MIESAPYWWVAGQRSGPEVPVARGTRMTHHETESAEWWSRLATLRRRFRLLDAARRELDAPRRARIRRMTSNYHRRKRGWKT